MKYTLLRTVLRKEVVGLARLTVIILAVFLMLLEFGYRADKSTSALLDQLSYGLVIAATFVTLGSLFRTWLRELPLRKAEMFWRDLPHPWDAPGVRVAPGLSIIERDDVA